MEHVGLINAHSQIYRNGWLNIALNDFSCVVFTSMREITQLVFAMLWTWWNRKPRDPPQRIRTFSNYWGCSLAANGRVDNWQPLKYTRIHKSHANISFLTEIFNKGICNKNFIIDIQEVSIAKLFLSLYIFLYISSKYKI